MGHEKEMEILLDLLTMVVTYMSQQPETRRGPEQSESELESQIQGLVDNQGLFRAARPNKKSNHQIHGVI